MSKGMHRASTVSTWWLKYGETSIVRSDPSQLGRAAKGLSGAWHDSMGSMERPQTNGNSSVIPCRQRAWLLPSWMPTWTGECPRGSITCRNNVLQAAAKLHDLGTQSAAPPSAAGSYLVHHSGNDAPLLEIVLAPCHGVRLAGSCLAIPADVHSIRCSKKLVTRSGTRQALSQPASRQSNMDSLAVVWSSYDTHDMLITNTWACQV